MSRLMMALLVLGGVVAGHARAAEVVVAEGGKARVRIVVAPAALEGTRAVAKELAGFLKRICGGEFEVTSGDGRGEGLIVLGTLAEFPDVDLVRALEVKNGVDGREAYAIRTDPGQRVRLIGASDLGASHAAYRWLETLGCRWFFPAAEWEVIPSSPTLKTSADEADRPVILSRRIWYGWGFFNDKDHPGKVQADYAAWARRNRMAASLPINAGHAWQDIIDQNKKAFAEHPEYLALTKGRRQGEQLCVSNAEVRRLAAEHVLKQFAKNPKLEMASIECSDGGGHCECDECKRLGSFSNQVFDLANHVARAVAGKYPGKMVGLLAYNEHSEPPTFDLEPNVYVQLTAGFTTGRYSFAELMDLWPKRCRNMGFYDYYSVWDWDHDRLPGGRAGDTGYVQRRVREYADRHASSVDAESGDNWGPHGRGYYLANRLMWNPRADAVGVLADFYEKAFGPAASVVRRYYERLDPLEGPVGAPVGKARRSIADKMGYVSTAPLSRHLIGLAYRDLEEATRLAKDRPDVLARLDHLKQYLRYEHLCQLRDREMDKAKQKELALAVIAYSYRTRWSYMTHWEAMRQSGTAKYAKQFGEPAWSIQDKTTPKSWEDARPVTPEETRRDFEEGLAYFVPEKIKARTFSADWAPMKPGDAPAKGVSRQAYQGGARYALYSRSGEDLSVAVTAGTIAWYRNRAEARYTLHDAVENGVAAEGRVPLDGERHVLTMKVPEAGLYYFDFDDSSAGWKIEAPAGTPLTIVLRPEKKLSHQGHMQEMFFYVPKGTRRVEYFWAGGPHNVHGPDGERVAEVTMSGEFVHVDVPAGADGRVWSFRQLALGHLWFFNCPNGIAGSREGLLVPRGMVE